MTITRVQALSNATQEHQQHTLREHDLREVSEPANDVYRQSAGPLIRGSGFAAEFDMRNGRLQLSAHTAAEMSYRRA
jgi:hypothetical protein